MNPGRVIGIGFLWPIIIVGGWGWIDKNEAWGWFFAAIAAAIVAFFAYGIWFAVAESAPIAKMQAEQRRADWQRDVNIRTLAALSAGDQFDPARKD